MRAEQYWRVVAPSSLRAIGSAMGLRARGPHAIGYGLEPSKPATGFAAG